MADDVEPAEPDALFAVEEMPAPAGGTNLEMLEASVAAGVKSGRIVPEDWALVQAARTAAIAMDAALRGKTPAYAVAACLRPYQDVLDRLGLNGRGELPTGGAGDGATAALLGALSGGPDPADR